MLLLRKIFFYVFLILYLIICPLIILRMLGYVIKDPRHFIKTGIIYVSSNPPDAHIAIDLHPLLDQTPMVIRDLLPGKHVVSITMPGYEPFEKQVLVQERKATALENILLFPNTWHSTELSTIGFNQLIYSQSNPFVLASQDDTVKGLFILPLTKDIGLKERQETVNLPTNLFPDEFIYKDAQIIKYFTVDKSPFVIIHMLIGDKHKYVWVDPREKQAHTDDITDLLPQEPQELWWEPQDEKNLYALEGNSINRINIKAKAIYPKIIDNVRTAAIAGNNIFVLTDDVDIVRYDLEGNNKKYFEVNLPEEFKHSTRHTLTPLTEKIFLLSSDAGVALVTASSINILTHTPQRSFTHDEEHTSIVLWDKTTIGLAHYSKNGLEETQFRVLYSQGTNIQQAFLINNGNTVLFKDNTSVFLLDTAEDNPRLKKVADAKLNSFIYFYEKSGSLYYIDAQTQFLSSISILDHRPLIPIPIADTLKIKKI